MSILILGNGFDLEHKLPTRYTDFLDYVIAKKQLLDVKNIAIGSLIIDNVWLEYFIALYRKGKLCGINWIDFEKEISHILKIFDEQDSNIYNPVVNLQEINDDEKMVLFYNLYARRIGSTDGVQEVHKQTYARLIENLYTDLDRMIRAFEIYLLEKVEVINVECISSDIQNIKANKILTFNYTKLYERRYANEKCEIHHIHGVVQENPDENNMVLGVDEYWEEPDCSNHTNYNIFKKFTQRILKETGFDYRNWIEQSKKSYIQHTQTRNRTTWNDMGITDVYVFGHSLDITDEDILREFFVENCFRVHIYYKDKQKQATLIANLIKMIGESEFIEQINAVPPKIEFIRQT